MWKHTGNFGAYNSLDLSNAASRLQKSLQLAPVQQRPARLKWVQYCSLPGINLYIWLVTFINLNYGSDFLQTTRIGMTQSLTLCGLGSSWPIRSVKRMKMTRKMCVFKNKYSFIWHDYIIKYEEQLKMYEEIKCNMYTSINVSSSSDDDDDGRRGRGEPAAQRKRRGRGR